jgi:hypothetical protein
MKNIHVLPTDKPSRLHLKSDGFYLTKEENSFIPYSYPKNIYITNDEEIKEGDWFITDKNTICKCVRVDWKYAYSIEAGSRSKNNCKKIILTTDQDLIGVQAIDDEFLEWFVAKANDSGKPIDIIDVTYGVLKPFQSEDKGYLIHCPDNEVLEESKQETIEEYIEKSYPKDDSSYDFTVRSKVRNGIREGAKWQQERMYSEEDMKEAFSMGRTGKTIEDFNIKFKNK